MPAKKFTKIDKFNIGFGIVNLVGVIIAISISIWGVKKSESIAEKSGAFDKGNLQLSLAGYFINPSTEFDIYFGLGFSDTSLHFIEMPVKIYNNGKKTVADVNLFFKYLHLFNIALNDSIIKYDGAGISQVKRTMTTNLPYDQVSFFMGDLNPNMSVNPNEFICALKEETRGEVSVPVYTKDSVLLNVSASYTYSYPTIISLTGKDIISQVYQVGVNYRKETDINALVKRVLEEKKSLRDKKNSSWANSFFVIIPKKKETIGEGPYKITILDSSEDSVLFCQFDTGEKHLVVLTADGKAKQLIDL